MTEHWRDIAGYEGRYQVSDQGRVRSLGRMVPWGKSGKLRFRQGRVRALATDRHGYRRITLRDTSQQPKGHQVHRLVLAAFVGPCPDGMQACHNDGDRANNHLVNLRWGTIVENARDRLRHGTNPAAAKTHCLRGHEFTPENTYLTPSRYTGLPTRHCRRCAAERARARRAVSA